jgi:hypothetical protein
MRRFQGQPEDRVRWTSARDILVTLKAPRGVGMMSEKKKPELTEKEIKEQDDYLEEALEETFPASDPISPGHVEKKPEDKK